MTTTIAVTMVKDEADIIESVLRNMAAQVDGIIVADNMSTDGTADILRSVQDSIDVPMHIVQDATVGYTQSAKMTDLATMARLALGADWIVPFDADEWWYSPFGRIADILDPIGEQWLVMPAVLYDHVATALDDEDEPDPVVRLGWRRTKPAPLPKVACRWREDLVIEMGNHGASYRGGATLHDSQLVIRHFPYRSPEQVVRKVINGARAYAATDLDPRYGAHWRQWGQILDQSGPKAIYDLFYTWYWRDEPSAILDLDGELQPPLIFDPVAALIRVIIPYGGDDPHRATSLAWILEQLPGQLDDATIVVGRCEGPWSKAVAVADGLDDAWPDDDILIVHDADIWIPKLSETIRFLQRFPWVVPHKFVHRMKPELSGLVLDGTVPFTGLGKVGWEQNPYPGVVGGGCTIMPVGSYRLCPLDPRFVGWGQEDESWGFALNQMLGRPWRGPHNLYHFWHPHPERQSRSVGSSEGEQLRNRYRGARVRNRLLMTRLLDEFREAPSDLG